MNSFQQNISSSAAAEHELHSSSPRDRTSKSWNLKNQLQLKIVSSVNSFGTFMIYGSIINNSTLELYSVFRILLHSLKKCKIWGKGIKESVPYLTHEKCTSFWLHWKAGKETGNHPLVWFLHLYFAVSLLANYLSSRWPRKWADILFMSREIHFVELSRDFVTPVQILTLDNCPSFKFHLIWIFQNHTSLCRSFLHHDHWVKAAERHKIFNR